MDNGVSTSPSPSALTSPTSAAAAAGVVAGGSGVGREPVVVQVGGLNPEIQEQQLQEQFAKCGAVSQIRIFRRVNAGTPEETTFALVTVSSAQEGQRAIAMLDGKYNWSVAIADPSAAQSTPAGMPAENNVRELWVGNLPYVFDEDDLRKEFRKFGPFEGFEVFRKQCFGFIKYYRVAEARAAHDAMKNFVFLNRPLKVSYAVHTRRHDIVGDSAIYPTPDQLRNELEREQQREAEKRREKEREKEREIEREKEKQRERERRERDRDREKERERAEIIEELRNPSFSLFVGFPVGSYMTEDSIRNVFGAFGTITSVLTKFSGSRGQRPYAFVDFERLEDATNALRSLTLEDYDRQKRQRLFGEWDVEIKFSRRGLKRVRDEPFSRDGNRFDEYDPSKQPRLDGWGHNVQPQQAAPFFNQPDAYGNLPPAVNLFNQLQNPSAAWGQSPAAGLQGALATLLQGPAAAPAAAANPFAALMTLLSSQNAPVAAQAPPMQTPMNPLAALLGQHGAPGSTYPPQQSHQHSVPAATHNSFGQHQGFSQLHESTASPYKQPPVAASSARSTYSKPAQAPLETVWSGFLTKHKSHKCQIDAYLIKGNSSMLDTESILNVSHRAHIEEVRRRNIYGLVLFQPSDDSHNVIDKEYIRYFQEKDRVGVVTLRRGLLYIVPPSEFASSLYPAISANQMLGIMVLPTPAAESGSTQMSPSSPPRQRDQQHQPQQHGSRFSTGLSSALSMQQQQYVPTAPGFNYQPQPAQDPGAMFAGLSQMSGATGSGSQQPDLSQLMGNPQMLSLLTNLLNQQQQPPR
eukprot:GILK01010279.1.p1 GENE.GILK01010279.1~~GILK01010279.1.p1  ORF type:complete len:815 (-),score=156.83 GILK01010279.1:129-2543(-)